MNKTFLVIALISGLAVGCGDDELFGTGGSGGAPPVIGPLLWTSPGYTIVGDTCGFLVEDEPLAFNITIQGSNVVMIDADPTANPDTALQGSTDNYSPEDNDVLLTNSRDDVQFQPDDGCVVQINDAFDLELTDPTVSLDLNDTVEVRWTNDQSDVSPMVGDCQGIWFFDLDCVAEATFTLTQQFE